MDQEPQGSPKQIEASFFGAKKIWIAVLAIAIVFCFIFSFLWLSTVPVHEGDEGFYLRIATERLYHLPHPLSLALVTSVSPQFPETPLFSLILSGWLKIFGVTLVAGRLLSVFVLLAIAALVGGIAYRLQGLRAAALSVFGLASIPYFWFYGREVLTHGLTIALILASLYALIAYKQTQRALWMVVCATCGVLAIFISYWALWYCLLLPMFAFFTKRWYRALALLPIFSLLGYWLERYWRYREVFVSDFHNLFFWQSTGGFIEHHSLLGQLIHGIGQIGIISILGPAMLFGVIGLFMCTDRFSRIVLATSFLVSAIFLYRDRYVVHVAYLLIMIAPFAAIGFGFFGDRILTNLPARWLSKRMDRVALSLVGIGLCAACLMFSIGFAWWVAAKVTQGNLSRSNLANIAAVTSFINKQATPNDFVIAPSEVYWQLRTKAVDHTWVYARQTGRVNDSFSARYPMDDSYFSYYTDFTHAMFVVERNTNKYIYLPDENKIIPISSWPSVYHDDMFTVYKNPSQPIAQ